MFCIKCHHASTKVTNSRPHKKSPQIWRRRHCMQCKATFTTLENVASEGLLWVTHENSREPFSHPTLMISLYEALKGLKNAPDDAYWLAQTVFETIMSTDSSGEIPAHSVSQAALSVLKRYDTAASMKYALAHGLVDTKNGRVRRPRSYKSPA